ncbi:MAG: FAD-linked oxidase C-terminal domain-containing protein [Myxococcota bacterium]
MATPMTLETRPRELSCLDELRRGLVDIVGDPHVITDPEALTPFGRDESHGLQPILPHAVVHASTSEEVHRVVALCARLGVPVTPRGAGTGRSGGCVPAQGGVVLTLTRMNRIREVSGEDLVAVVEPGVILGDLQNAVEDAGLFYPPDPASWQSCTVGGTVAENAGGPRAVRYGVTRDYVLGMTVVLSSGEVIRVGKRTVKGVTGYDLTALLVGSEGTLGIITEVTLKLIPRPRAVETALFIFPDAARASRAVAAILQAGIQPRTLEYMDRASIDALRPLAPYKFPTNAGAALIVETDADQPEAAFAQLNRAADVGQKFGAQDVLVAQDAAQRNAIWQSRHLLSQATRRIRKHKRSEDIVVPRSRLPEMVARMDALGEKHGLQTCSFGHAGDGNLHAQVLYDDPATQMPAVEACLRDIAVTAVELGGCITAEHGVGLLKRSLLPIEQEPPVIDLQKRLKQVFDPAGILNPGKIFP